MHGAENVTNRGIVQHWRETEAAAFLLPSLSLGTVMVQGPLAIP